MKGAAQRHALTERLRERQGEIEAALMTRVYAIADPTEARDPQYAEGLRAAVPAALEHALAGIEADPLQPPPVPAELLAQARTAARSRVGLDTVIRRYIAGHAILAAFVLEAAEHDGGLSREQLQRLLAAQASQLDRLIAEVSAEHRREAQRPAHTTEQARLELVCRLLAGEAIEASGLGYGLEQWHVGVVAEGPGAREALAGLARALDRRLLCVEAERGRVWGWLGGAGRISTSEVVEASSATWPSATMIAIGEPGEGLHGWRLTHRQAATALSCAGRGHRSPLVYAEVALVAAALNDDLLYESLSALYIRPLAAGSGGEILLSTLGAYFAAGRNAASAAAALDVTRQTVRNRLRLVEKRIGRRLDRCGAELELALQVEALAVFHPSPAPLHIG